MIVGTAMLTIVVSSKIAKKPTQITASASHGLVSRATRSVETVGAAAPAMELTSLAIGDHLLVHGHVPEAVLRLVACLRGVWESQGGTTTAWLQSAHLLVLDLPHDSISVSRKCQLDIPKFQLKHGPPRVGSGPRTLASRCGPTSISCTPASSVCTVRGRTTPRSGSRSLSRMPKPSFTQMRTFPPTSRSWIQREGSSNNGKEGLTYERMFARMEG